MSLECQSSSGSGDLFWSWGTFYNVGQQVSAAQTRTVSESERVRERVRLFTPPVCASVRQTALHLRLTPLSKHTMDSWTVAASFLLIGFISSAALSHFDTGKENFSAPSFPPGMRSEVECAWWEASPKSTSSLLNHISWITQTHTNSALTYFGLFWTITVPWESLFMVHGLGSSLTTRDLFSLLPPNLHAASGLRVFGVRPKQKSQGRCCVSTIIEWVNEQRDWSDQILLLPPHAYCVNTYDPSSVSKDNRLAVLTKLMLWDDIHRDGRLQIRVSVWLDVLKVTLRAVTEKDEILIENRSFYARLVNACSAASPGPCFCSVSPYEKPEFSTRFFFFRNLMFHPHILSSFSGLLSPWPPSIPWNTAETPSSIIWYHPV